MSKLIGTKKFYKMLIIVVLPLILQQGISSFVSLLDNVMVGSLGTEEMSGVAIVNQLLFVVYLGTFGILSGASIFSSQFFGAKNEKGIKDTFHFKVWASLAVFLVSIVILLLFGSSLIKSFIQEDSEVGDPALVYNYAMDYLKIMLFSLFGFIVTQLYSTTLREGKDTILPMISSLVSISVNLVFNYLLIFGSFGFPRLGIKGAALATVLSRIVEMLTLIIPSHICKKKYPYFKGVYKSLKVPTDLVKKIIRKGLPLFLNEIMWSSGMTKLFQIYSLRGLEAVASFNISSTISNLFMVFFQAIGNAVAIVIGQLLGNEEYEEAKKQDKWMFFTGVVVAVFFGIVLIITAKYIPYIYNVEDEIRKTATSLMIVVGACMPLYAYSMISYFTLRSGGVTYITFVFDSMFVWIVNIPIAFVLFKYTTLSLPVAYFIVQIAEIIKVIFGTILVSKGIWVKNIIKVNNLKEE